MHKKPSESYSRLLSLLEKTPVEFLSKTNNNDWSCLHYAAESGQYKTIEFILNAVPGIADWKSNVGQYAYKVAELNEYYLSADLIVSWMEDSDGLTEYTSSTDDIGTEIEELITAECEELEETHVSNPPIVVGTEPLLEAPDSSQEYSSPEFEINPGLMNAELSSVRSVRFSDDPLRPTPIEMLLGEIANLSTTSEIFKAAEDVILLQVIKLKNNELEMIFL